MVKVIMYHRIVDDYYLSSKYWTCVHADNFRRQLQLLERWGFTTITFNDYKLYLEGQLNLPRKPVIITFDDGYYDTYQLAYPLLSEFGMKAVVYVLGNVKTKSNKWDRHSEYPESPLMTDLQIMELHDAGFEIGSHSITHPKLTAIPEQEAWDEISRSRMLLEILLNSTVISFSYPYGMLNMSIKKMVEDAGYAFGCGVYTGPATFGAEPYDIRRITISNNTGPIGFGSKLLLPYELYSALRHHTKQLVVNSFEKTKKPSKKVIIPT